eukprot:comp9416_c0_seq1/m.4463 comp9416_c0_seq1/g.4463  ORF comp9416_c0_seq1/g.4463 comp9416_c0_seq1/m.4463 type:complete len:294 (-) comp9416_c0_seq1:291-1172(-)
MSETAPAPTPAEPTGAAPANRGRGRGRGRGGPRNDRPPRHSEGGSDQEEHHEGEGETHEGDEGRNRGRGRGRGRGGERGRGGRRRSEEPREGGERQGPVEPPMNAQGVRELRVSSQSNPKSVAGAVAKSVREANYPEIRAVGELSVNQAVKAVAIARSYLSDDNLDICFQPELRDQDQFEFAVGLITYEAQRRNEVQNAAVAKVQQEIKVAASSKPGEVAGAIANRVRKGERVCVTAIGATSVSLSIRAIAMARQYLYNDSYEIFCKPQFDHVEVENGEQRSSMKLCLLSVQM